MSNQLGEYLKELRRAKGLTTRQVAAISGFNQSTITLLENGQRSASLGRLWWLVKAVDGDFRQALYFLCLDAGVPNEVAQEVLANHPHRE